ncbi:diguanylate cyclase domain-containing protein [Acinetobacter sp. MD2]|uniref:sensor domain-containing diguanylate cyclase n=1 Tax=Acinetobacter sp. MD2 TaxID=2600066 RepID=UPI002D1F6AA9|nr:diguanylate cyclase [Acinetobacter sp. MD2]MEB3768108.1 diguanylate cyclase [Acinetobacter sp. MD2]
MIRFNKVSSLKDLFKRAQVSLFILTISICTFIFVVISAITLNTYAKQTLNILSKALNERIQPAVVFNDKATMNQILLEYMQEYPIRTIVIQNPEHQILASTSDYPKKQVFIQNILDQLFFHTPITTTIQHENRQFGTIIIYGSSSNLIQFFFTSFIGLGLGISLILITLLYSMRANYQFIFKQISPILTAAQNMSNENTYYQRLPESQIKEFQSLNTIFNHFLAKIHASTLELKQENSQLTHQANHDQLTQLPNRHYFYHELFAFFESQNRKNAALLFIDNNNFKAINDQYGHLAGDTVLQEMALRLKNSIRKDDLIARLGGDEFAIFIQDIENTEQVITICNKLLSSSETPIFFNKNKIKFSFSIGIAFTIQASSPEHLITDADNAMYVAKTIEQGWYIASNHSYKDPSHV